MPPTADLVLAVDCSTSAAKAVLFDAAGRSVGSGRRTFGMQRPRVGWHEQDAPDWWEATRGAIIDAAGQIDPARIAAVVVTHQRETFVCLDDQDVPVRPAIVWADNRSTPQVARYGSERTHRISGRVPDITPSIFKLTWLKENEPETLARAARIGDVSAYLNLRLVGRWVSSLSSADSLGLLDLAARQWSAELCAIAGVNADQLPELVESGTIIGHLNASIASQLGLQLGTPVVAGAGDGQCAALGAGLSKTGTMYLNMGTAIVAGYSSAEFLWSRKYRTVLEATGDGYLLETLQQAGTYLVTWFMEHFGPPASATAPEVLMEREASSVPAGSDGLLALPYWNGAQTPHWNGDARGAVIGWTGSHTRAHFYRALLEGIAFDIRLSADGVQGETGQPVQRFLITGGGSRSPLWNQIIADVTGRQVDVCAELETTALGAAIIGATAVGLHPTTTAAAETMTAVINTYTPEPAAMLAYHHAYKAWARLYPALHSLQSQ